MLELMVIDPAAAVPDDAHLLTRIFHAESACSGLLVCHNRRNSRTLHNKGVDSPLSGVYHDHKLQCSYYLNGLVHWQSQADDPGELGAWYTTLHGLDPDGRGPHWWRPLYTSTDTGWLNTDSQGQLRFRPTDPA